MTLIKSISGIRGTIGEGPVGDSLSPVDIVKFTAAYAAQLKEKFPDQKLRVVVGRDARMSGQMVEMIVCGTLISCGVDVIDAGLASTPTTEMAVIFEKANGGIILTASHNPKQWNALKLLNEKGEFLNAEEGGNIVKCAEDETFEFAKVDQLGTLTYKDFTEDHIKAVLDYPLVDVQAIADAKLKVVVDPINSVGSIVVPMLLDELGVDYVVINAEPNGNFEHNPEPIPENLTGLSSRVVEEGADMGIAVDPDVDRLAFISENGEPFGEEYTLVAVADYILSHKKGATVSNLSSSRALRDVTEAHGCTYHASAVGELNVSTLMQKESAVIGGEGNGGVIVPDLHYGRDAIIGIALFLTHLAKKKLSMSALRATYPDYYISKNKVELTDKSLIDKILDEVKEKYSEYRVSTYDGVKVDFDADHKWICLRKSNTEPIIRIYCEAHDKESADALANEVIEVINDIVK